MRLHLAFVAALVSGIYAPAARAALYPFSSSGEVVVDSVPVPYIWYPDRFPPAAFMSGQNGGNRTGVLQEDISLADSATNRDSAFSSAFYNTQGRKLDLFGANALFIDLYVPQAWDSLVQIDGRLASLWATGFDAANSANGFFPIIEFNNNRPGGNGAGFRVWDSNSESWFDVGGFAGYDHWHRIGFILSGGEEQFYVNGNFVGAVNDANSTQFGNIILQGYNSGNSYTISWDNLSIMGNLQDALPVDPVPEPTMLAIFGLPLAGLGLAAMRRRAR